MIKSPNPEPVNFITLGDVYFALFRQKWLILCFTLAGVAAAAVYFNNYPPPFQSDAELIIRYIVDTRTVSGPTPANNTQTTTPAEMADSIVNAEMYILKSFDLAQMVASNIGPDKIMAAYGGGNNLIGAANLIRANLQAEALPRSTIIHLTFAHSDPSLVQPVLREILTDYLIKHHQIHQAGGTSYEFLGEETSMLKEQISLTEDEIRAAKTNAGIISVEASDKTISEQVAKIQEELFQAQIQLAGYEARFNSDTNIIAALMNMPAEKLDAFQRMCERLTLLTHRQDELVTGLGYKETNTRVMEGSAQIQDLKKELLEKYPELAGLTTLFMGAGFQTSPLGPDGIEGVILLKSKINVLNQQLKQVWAQAADEDMAKSKIIDLQRKKQIQDANYQYYATTLEQAKMDEAIGPGRVSNIGSVEPPTPPYKDLSKFNKKVTRLLGSGLLTGLALALLLELVIDQRVKRPAEIEARLHLRLFLVIPYFGRRWNRAVQRPSPLPLLETAAESSGPEGGGPAADPTGPGLASGGDPLAFPYYDTLRDRLTSYFDSIDLTRKPKLVAVTSTENGSGVSSIAAGLADSLSAAGDGRVLLVKMNGVPAAGRTYVNGKPACELEDALVAEKRGVALVQENLYVVEEVTQGDKRPRVLPKRFAALVPKFKASDYDFIVFDMPPVSQTSVTARLAGLVDMTLLVVAAEKSNREVVRQAGLLLTQSKATVGVVLNKTKKYVPGLLHRDFLEGK